MATRGNIPKGVAKEQTVTNTKKDTCVTQSERASLKTDEKVSARNSKDYTKRQFLDSKENTQKGKHDITTPKKTSRNKAKITNKSRNEEKYVMVDKMKMSTVKSKETKVCKSVQKVKPQMKSKQKKVKTAIQADINITSKRKQSATSRLKNLKQNIPRDKRCTASQTLVEGTVSEPCDSKASGRGPGSAVRGPDSAGRGPGSAGRGPGSAAGRGPGSAGRGPGSAAGRGPGSAGRGPGSASVRGPGSAGRGPGSAGRVPGSAGRGPGSAGRGPGSAGRGPGSAERGPGSAERGPGSAGRGPGSAGRGGIVNTKVSQTSDIAGCGDQDISIISESGSDSDFEVVEPCHSRCTDLKPKLPQGDGKRNICSIKGTRIKDKVKENVKNVRKYIKETTENEKKFKTEVDENTTKPVKRRKKDLSDNLCPVKKMKTEVKKENPNLTKRKVKIEVEEENGKEVIKKKKVFTGKEKSKSKKQTTLKDKNSDQHMKEKERSTTKSELEKKTKKKRSSNSSKRIKGHLDKVANMTFDETDVTSVLLKMEGISAEQSASKGADNSSEESDLSGSEDEDWEEVADHHMTVKSQIPDEPIEITLSAPNFMKKKKKKAFDWVEYVRRQMRRIQREVQVNVHKVHLMCLVAWGVKQNSLFSSDPVCGLALSLIPDIALIDPATCDVLELSTAVKRIRNFFTVHTGTEENDSCTLMKEDDLEKAMLERSVNSERMLVAICVVFLRMMSFNARLLLSFYPVPLRLPQDTKTKTGKKKLDDDADEPEKSEICKQESRDNQNKDQDVAKVKTKTKISTKKSKTRVSDRKVQKKPKCKYFKSKTSGERLTQKISNSNALNSRNLNTNLSVKECKTISSKLSTKLKQASSENSDSDNILVSNPKLKQKLKPRASTSMSKQGQQGVDNSDESGYEETYVSNDDSDFCDDEPLSKRRGKKLVTKKARVKKRRSRDSAEESFSSDFEDDVPACKGPVENRKTKGKLQSKGSKMCDSWIEVYLPKLKRWLCVDCVRNIMDKPKHMEKEATSPVHYVFAFSTDSSVKDVTCRYASEWMTRTRKLRVEADWLNKMLKPFRSSDIEMENQDDENMKDELLRKPLPKTVGEFKNHQLYVLKRHLLKFEALYPNSAVPVGYIRGEPIYARECVHTLHSRENWLKEGRSVKLGEEAYKMVKSRKWKVPKINPDALDLELFGPWQTEIYVPPPVIDGKIPRNAYGNLELFQDWMLPAGTVQVKLPGLNRIARKLEVDCVAAMVGWDTHSGFSHPLMDGWVVCKEHKEALEAAWEEDQEIQHMRELEKRHKRALDNWRLLTRSLIIGDRLKKRFDLEKAEVNTETVKDGKKADDVQSSWPRNREEKKNEPTSMKSRLCSVETL